MRGAATSTLAEKKPPAPREPAGRYLRLDQAAVAYHPMDSDAVLLG
jgi:hypothetical protein